MDASEEQQATEGNEQHAVGLERNEQQAVGSGQEAAVPDVQSHAAGSLQPVEEEPQSCHKPKRHLSRSMDLSGSVSSRAPKHRKQSENPQSWHLSFDPAVIWRLFNSRPP